MGSLSFTLPLNDGALGTTPLTHQQPASSLLKTDVRYVAAAIPRIFSALAASLCCRWRELGWCGLQEEALYFIASILELQLLLSVTLLWLMLPGIVLLPWLSIEVALVWFLVRFINKQPQIFTIFTGAAKESQSGEIGVERQQQDWFVVGGMAANNDQMHRKLVPKLMGIFGHDMHVFLSPRLGFPLDIAFLILQRNIYVPTARSTALYNSVRTSLLKPGTAGVYIIAHNTGSLDITWLLSRLCADFPAGELLGKLQVFTFGAASAETTLPLGSTYCQGGGNLKSVYPTVTNFAFADDPFAQIGVLMGIRYRIEGRLVGSLYTIGSSATTGARFSWAFRGHKHSLHDYLDTILPNGDPSAGVLNQVCSIDREVSEMRELAALAQSLNNVQLRMRKGTKRLSWTALGILAGSSPGGSRVRTDMAGLFSLEEVRKRGKMLEGMRGYDNNPLVEAVANRYHLSSPEIRSPCGREWLSQP
ncbi:hypothetical protein F5B20DRAFT_582760 [Whalleya microplaca]|nr:hypothetical protein F5B20DRAFT_582760 [Whalleya microplaca]